MEDKPKHYLFVCHANMHRSKTAEDVCKKIVEQNNLGISVSSAGMSRGCANPISEELADTADVIFVMEEHMKIELEKIYGQDPGKIVCLDIPDLYERNDPMLVRILRTQLYEHFRS